MVLFLVDECVSYQTLLLLKELGYTATIFKVAQEKKAVLVTYDKGFANIKTCPPSKHNGVILLRVSNLLSLKKCNEVLRILLSRESSFKGTLFVVTEQKYRKRTKP